MDDDIAVHFAKSKPSVSKKVKPQSLDPKKNLQKKNPSQPLPSQPLPSLLQSASRSVTNTVTPTPLDLVVDDVQRKVLPSQTFLGTIDDGVTKTNIKDTVTSIQTKIASLPPSFSRRNPNRQAPAYTPAVISIPNTEKEVISTQPVFTKPSEPKLIEHDMDEVEGTGGIDNITKCSNPQDAFSALGLDARLVAKITAPASVKGPSTDMTLHHHHQQQQQQHHMSSSAGIVRGQLRDGFGLQSPTRVQRGMIPLALSGRSLVVKSETGSGKSLAFLLPIVQGLLGTLYPQSEGLNDGRGGGDTGRKRGEGGTRALIISPTRELCAQLFTVLTRLLQPFPLLVPCLLAGGEKRKSEKARLRKGCTIVIATPGRLLDHLRLTSSFVCSTETIQWLVLDEADRMLDMGFGQQVRDIMACLKERGKGPISAVKAYDPDRRHDDEDEDEDEDDFDLNHSNQKSHTRKHVHSTEKSLVQATSSNSSHKVTVFLISATITPAVKELALSVLFTDAMFLDASSANLRRVAATAAASADAMAKSATASPLDLMTAQQTAQIAAKAAAFSAPKQLNQSAMLVPLKWRLVTLFAVLVEAIKKARNITRQQQSLPSLGQPQAQAHCKVIVFFSTTDSVDFHYRLLAALLPRALVKGGVVSSSSNTTRDGSKSSSNRGLNIEDFAVSRLHGNVPQNERTSVFRAFSAATSGLMIATDVAARGLDLPAVDLIVQCDAPSEMQDYVHRIGRTARKGLAGNALIFLQPHESPYLTLLQASGLDVKLLETTPALSGLGDAIMPLELLSIHATKTESLPTPISSQLSSTTSFESSQLKKNGKVSERDRENAHFARLLSGSVGAAEAEAIAATSAVDAEENKKREKQGLGDNKSSSRKSNSGWNEEARDPESGVPLRLLSLIRRAKQIRNREGKGIGFISTSSLSSSSSSSSSSSKGEEVSGGGDRDRGEDTPLIPVISSAQEQAEAWAVAWQFFLEDVAVTGLPQGTSSFSSSSLIATSSLLPLLPLARLAFMSFVRAYATHEKSVRHIFHTRALHLGHAAKAFALREQPKDVSKAAKDEARAEVDATNAAATATNNTMSSSSMNSKKQIDSKIDTTKSWSNSKGDINVNDNTIMDEEMMQEPERTKKPSHQQSVVRTNAPSGPQRWAENSKKGSIKNNDSNSKKRASEEIPTDAMGRPIKKIKRAAALSEFDA
jgi:ATP-dependent RNA helicase DDX31/DBP7